MFKTKEKPMNKNSTTMYLKPKEAATFLKVSTSTLARWRHKGLGPSYSKLETGSILYCNRHLIEFIELNLFFKACPEGIEWDEETI